MKTPVEFVYVFKIYDYYVIGHNLNFIHIFLAYFGFELLNFFLLKKNKFILGVNFSPLCATVKLLYENFQAIQALVVESF